MKEIKLTQGKVALVDDDDFDKINQHRWALNPQGKGYAVRKGNKRRGEPRTIHMHRVVMCAPDGVQIDHINGNSLDNRKENLRLVDTQRNAFNRKKPNVSCTSQYKGVIRRKNSPSWHVRIKFNDRQIELGSYSDEAFAAAVYNFASRIFFGVYRRENTGSKIHELDESEQYSVYRKCKKYIERYGWYVDTDTYRSFYMRG